MPEELANRCFGVQQVRHYDARLIRERGIAGILLMKRAGEAAFEHIVSCYGAKRMLVMCGKGNNAGDGYIIAGLAQNRGAAVEVLQVCDESGAAPQFSGDALLARDWALAQGVRVQPFSTQTGQDALLQLQASSQNGEPPDSPVVIVDALLGTGIQGTPRPNYRAAIRWMNQLARQDDAVGLRSNSGSDASSLVIVAVDLPSGVNADTGAVTSDAVNAHSTVTFILPKTGLFTGAGAACAGEVTFADLGMDPDWVAEEPSAQCLRLGITVPVLPERQRDSHKGRFGHVLLLGGDHGMGGAIVLAAEAAQRAGAGLVSIATRTPHVAALLARNPAVMARDIDADTQATGNDFDELLQRASVLGCGPGLGRNAWGRTLFARALASGLPTVVDADALHILKELVDEGVIKPEHLPELILTPHPGEAAALLDCSTTDIQQDRLAAAKELASRFRATIVLKGMGSIVVEAPYTAGAPGARCGIVCHGNPGMASGGMGDVLTGVSAAVLGQIYAAAGDNIQGTGWRAATLAACVHAAAADQLADRDGEIGLSPADLPREIRRLLNGVNLISEHSEYRQQKEHGETAQ